MSREEPSEKWKHMLASRKRYLDYIEMSEPEPIKRQRQLKELNELQRSEEIESLKKILDEREKERTNETKKISLEGAKAEIKRISQEARECREFTRPEAFDQALDILENVEMPSEDEWAVLWLIREHGWVITMHLGHWTTDLAYGPRVNPINPADEARKLGWGG